MKKNILLALCCCSLLAFTACSDDYNDATEKHVYGENENPYLKIDAEAQIPVTAALEVNGEHSYTVNLADYAAKFEEKLGMSVDAVMKGLDSGETIFYPINLTRNQWIKTPYNKDNAGWYFNSANQPCSADDAACKAFVTLDKATKNLKVELSEGGIVAGTVLALEVGFAKNGPDYDNYVRFTMNVSVTDPTVAVLSVTFSADAPVFTANLENYKENIEAVFDMSYDDFLAAIAENESIKFSLANPETGEWTDLGEHYTANAPGYWLDKNGSYINWGVDGFAAYIEYYKDDAACGIGYNGDLPSGTSGKFNVGWVDVNNPSKFFRFVTSWTIQ